MSNLSFCVLCQKHWDTPRVKFFHIPKDPERRKVWSEICGMELKDCFKICEQHFSKESIVFSRTYKRHRLLKFATPAKELVYIVPKIDELKLIKEDIFDETEDVEFVKLSQEQTKPKNASTQTHYSKQLYSCGFLQVSKDYRIFNISCFYCKSTFTLWNYASFIQHIKAKHRYEEDVYGQLKILNGQTLEDDVATEDVDMKEYTECETIDVVDYEDDFIEYDPAGYESQPEVINTEEVERLKGLLARNNVIVKKFEDVSEDVNEIQVHNDSTEEIDIEATEEDIVYAFIDMLKTYPILWHPPPLKLPENYLLTLLEFCKVFNEKYQLAITNSGMRNSLENLQKWYQLNYIDSNYEKLSYPQSEYIHRCAEFLSDQADGSKTCELCQQSYYDYVQYMLHKQIEHDIPMSESALPNEQVEQYLRTRWYRVQNLQCQINIETTPVEIVNGFLVLLESYPVLWVEPQTRKLSDLYMEAVYEFVRIFNEIHKLHVSSNAIENSLKHIIDWYRLVTKNDSANMLPEPQIEYYQKLASYLPEAVNGAKLCELCRYDCPDYLQYTLHKHLEHPEACNDGVNIGEAFNAYIRAGLCSSAKIRECRFCEKDITRKLHYIEHLKAHANIRDAICDVCGQTFVRVKDMTTHRRRHTGQIQRFCKICGKGFNDFQLLSMHRRRYHRPIEGTIEEIEQALKQRKRPVRRNTYSTKYATRLDPNTLKRHYVCQFCNKEYHQYSGLHKHLRLWHKDDWEPAKRYKKENHETEESFEEEILYEISEDVEEIEIESLEETEDCKIEIEYDMELAEEIEIQ